MFCTQFTKYHISITISTHKDFLQQKTSLKQSNKAIQII